MSRAFLGLGSNIGERLSFIEKAVEMVASLDKTSVVKSSSIYETEPWGLKDQPEFLNSVIEIETTLTPEELFFQIKEIENMLHRKNRQRWAEREIDIDILFYDDKIIQNETILIPHNKIEDRKFVLVPLNEIAPDYIHPVQKKTISELLKLSKDNLEVKKLHTT